MPHGLLSHAAFLALKYEGDFMRAYDVAVFLGNMKKTKDGFLCRCPCHKDTESSLKVIDKDGGHGVAVHCFGGCDWRIVRDRLKDMGLIDG